MKLNIVKKTSRTFDEETFSKYIVIISLDSEIISKFSFWYQPETEYFAQDLIAKNCDMNQQTHYWLGGVVSKNYKEIFPKVVEHKYQEFVAKKFDKIWKYYNVDL